MRTINQFLLKLDKSLNDKIKTSEGLELFLIPQFNHNWNVTTSGIVHTVPYGFKGVKEGDEVAISFKVVSERKFPSHINQFMLVKDGGDQYKEWSTSKGYYLTKICMPTSTGAPMWAGYLIYRGKWIDGTQGSQSDVERWLSQFPLDYAKKYYYKNIVEINGETFWRANKIDIFAKRLPDGTLVSVSDRLITKPVVEELTDKYNIINGAKIEGKLIGKHNDRGEVVAAPAHSGFKKGDIVGFEPRFNEKYTLWGREYYLIRKNFVQCIW